MNCLAEKIEITPYGFAVSYGERHYELRAIEKPSSSRLKATIKAFAEEKGRFHIDTVDFYLSRSRRLFVTECARLFAQSPTVIEEDLNAITLQLESYVEKLAADALPITPLISEPDRAKAKELGSNPHLIDEILKDIERLGMVGEKTNSILAYLVMTSRKMSEPLSLLILSGSGAGKSFLQDTILSLCPEEDLISLTALSNRALFYKGTDSLKNKVLAIQEEAGAAGAHYAIRNLISSKKLVIESTVKNPLTGKLETQTSVVRGPCSVFQTTTQPEADAETRSRFLITSVDESPEQTRAILEAQRQNCTLEGILRKKNRDEILSRHHAFQRLLKPLKVINTVELSFSYQGSRLLSRRDHPKYLSLILATAFLHQFQRPIKHHPEIGDYIETTAEDVKLANQLFNFLSTQSSDDISGPSQRLLGLIIAYVQKKAVELSIPQENVEFSRRELREALGWSEYQLRTHLKQLVSLEYLIPVRGKQGQGFSYRLAELRDFEGTSSMASHEVNTLETNKLGKLRGFFRGIYKEK